MSVDGDNGRGVPDERRACGTADAKRAPTESDSQEVDRWAEVPSLLEQLYRIVGRLQDLFPGRKFTPDGHLIGSIGEAVAARMFDLRLLPASTEAHDAHTADGCIRVQIKMTQGNRGVGLRAKPDHLLVLRLAKDLSIEVVYNGGGQRPWLEAGKEQTNGQHWLSLSRLRKLQAKVVPSERLPQRHRLDLRDNDRSPITADPR